jgi:ABC-2 type transport system permease protein
VQSRKESIQKEKSWPKKQKALLRLFGALGDKMPKRRFDILRDIYSIWLREMTRYARARSRVIISFVQPIVWLILFGVGFSSSLGSSLQFAGSAGTNYLDFLVPGLLGLMAILNSFTTSSGISFMVDKQFGFLKEILVAPVSRPSILLGKALGGTTTALIQGLVLVIVAALLGVRISGPLGFPLAFALTAAILFLITMGFSGLGLSIASQVENLEGFQLVMVFLALPLFFLSGALFPVTSLPVWMKVLVDINPLTYAVDALRYAIVGLHAYPLTLDLSIVVGFFVLVTAVGSVLFRNVH